MGFDALAGYKVLENMKTSPSGDRAMRSSLSTKVVSRRILAPSPEVRATDGNGSGKEGIPPDCTAGSRQAL